MADDLASFIESQKRKLEKERSEILLGQGGEVTSRNVLNLYGTTLIFLLVCIYSSDCTRIICNADVRYVNKLSFLSVRFGIT